MKRSMTLMAAMATTFGFAGTASAVEQLVGDIDGFGYTSTAGLRRTTGAPADTDGDNRLEAGEFLADLNQNGSTAVNSGDNFDNRSAAEMVSLDGAQHTDRSKTPAGASHNATFIFDFAVPVLGQNDFGVDHYINFVFGDYEVTPASIEVDGVVIPLTAQTGGQDGLIQAAFAEVPWTAMTDGEVVIRILAPNEPYLAFDYALLSTDQIADQDGDGVPDSVDNCIFTANQNQADSDHDGIGDACDTCHDPDADGVCGAADNCPTTANPGQQDADGDGAGDACDVCPLDAGNDADGDGICANADNCPLVANGNQADEDADGIGDACDPCSDADHDGVCATEDSCPGTQYPEAVPTVSLGTNRWVLGPNGVFITNPSNGRGNGPGRSYSIQDTQGCGCAQIIEALHLGAGHTKFGCSIGVMDNWIASFN